MRIDEVLRKPHPEPIEWHEWGPFGVRSSMKDRRGREINILFTDIGPKSYDVVFAVGGNVFTTGRGNEIEVFGKVLHMMREFNRRYNPQLLTFSALEPEKIPLYDRLVKKFAPEAGFKSFTPVRAWLEQLLARLKKQPTKQYFLKRVG